MREDQCACMVSFIDRNDRQLILEVEIQNSFGLVYFDLYRNVPTIGIDEIGTIAPNESNPQKGTNTYRVIFDIVKDQSKETHLVRVYHLYDHDHNLASNYILDNIVLENLQHKPKHKVIDPRLL